ncbi:hypothetical protein D3C72_2061810 [compost metagenome]
MPSENDFFAKAFRDFDIFIQLLHPFSVSHRSHATPVGLPVTRQQDTHCDVAFIGNGLAHTSKEIRRFKDPMGKDHDGVFGAVGRDKESRQMLRGHSDCETLLGAG